MRKDERTALDALLVKLMGAQDDVTHCNEAKDTEACILAKNDREFVRRQIVAFVEMIVR